MSNMDDLNATSDKTAFQAATISALFRVDF